MSDRDAPLLPSFIAEVVGTFLLIFLGCGAVHTAVTTGALQGVGQVAAVWGIAVSLAIYSVGGISGAHINPAITLGMAAIGRFSWSRVAPYWTAQLIGAAIAALALHLIFAGAIAEYESREGIVRGQPESIVTASLYGEYSPNPTVDLFQAAEPSSTSGEATGSVGRRASRGLSLFAAVLAEICGTAVLAFVVVALTHPRNAGTPGAGLTALAVGATVAALVSVLGPLTQACLNPARDFGPRIVAALAGWGEVAFPGPDGAFHTLAIYLFGPLAGGVLGAASASKLYGGGRAP